MSEIISDKSYFIDPTPPTLGTIAYKNLKNAVPYVLPVVPYVCAIASTYFIVDSIQSYIQKSVSEDKDSKKALKISNNFNVTKAMLSGLCFFGAYQAAENKEYVLGSSLVTLALIGYGKVKEYYSAKIENDLSNGLLKKAHEDRTYYENLAKTNWEQLKEVKANSASSSPNASVKINEKIISSSV